MLYKNGDPWFNGFEVRFVPGREFKNLDGLFAKFSNKLDMVNGIAYMFDSEGQRITSIEQIEDGGAYVCSENRRFIAANYGKTGQAFNISGVTRCVTKAILQISDHQKSELFTKLAPAGGY